MKNGAGVVLKNEIDILKDVSIKLTEAAIPFMMTGSMAMNYYAKPRMTRDIDIIISIGKKDVNILFSLFKKDYYISKEAVLESIQHHSMFNIIHNESVIKVDLILLKDDEYRQVEFERRQCVKIRNFKTYIVSKEDLIISKLLWAKDTHSELQMSDVKNLIQTGCDEAYILTWVGKLGLTNSFEEANNG